MSCAMSANRMGAHRWTPGLLHTQDGSIDISKALRERLQLFAAGTTPSVPWDSAAKGCWADLAV